MSIQITPEFISIIITLITSVATLAYMFGKIIKAISNLEKDMDKRFEQVDKRFEQVDKRFEQVDKRFEQVDKKFEQIDKRFEQVDRKFEKLETRLSEFALNTEKRLSLLEGQFSVAGNSPKKQTKGGLKIFADLDGEKFIDGNYDALKNAIAGTTRYQIQVQAVDAIEKCVPEDLRLRMEDYAYQEGWTLQQIYEAFGLNLRDKIFREKNIFVP